MPIQAACTFCSAKLKVKDELVGRSIKCPKCAKTFKVAANEDEKETVVKTKTAMKKAAPWANGKVDEDEKKGKASPWDAKAKAKKDKEEEKPKAKPKPPSKKRSAEDDEDDEDDDKEVNPQKGTSLGDMLNQTTLPEGTKSLIEGEMGLREKAMWVG